MVISIRRLVRRTARRQKAGATIKASRLARKAERDIHANVDHSEPVLLGSRRKLRGVARRAMRPALKRGHFDARGPRLRLP